MAVDKTVRLFQARVDVSHDLYTRIIQGLRVQPQQQLNSIYELMKEMDSRKDGAMTWKNLKDRCSIVISEEEADSAQCILREVLQKVAATGETLLVDGHALDQPKPPLKPPSWLVRNCGKL